VVKKLSFIIIIIEEDYSIFGKRRSFYDVAINSSKVNLATGFTQTQLQQKYYEGFKEGYVVPDILVYKKTSTKLAAKGRGITDIYRKERISELEAIENPTVHQ
jgi:hypothetical protein